MKSSFTPQWNYWFILMEWEWNQIKINNGMELWAGQSIKFNLFFSSNPQQTKLFWFSWLDWWRKDELIVAGRPTIAAQLNVFFFLLKKQSKNNSLRSPRLQAAHTSIHWFFLIGWASRHHPNKRNQFIPTFKKWIKSKIIWYWM